MGRAKAKPQRYPKRRTRRNCDMPVVGVLTALAGWVTEIVADLPDEEDADEDGRFFGGGLNSEQNVRSVGCLL
jgi:hypothetical protein